ncbi:hypothetical protein GCM10027030_21150 [Luteococcus sediminum]
MTEHHTGQQAQPDEQVEGALEALLLMAEEAMSSQALAEAVQQPVEVVERALASLVDFYDRTGRGFELRRIGGGWRYWTRAEHAELISAWVVSGQQNKLSQAALETLSVVAYLQPISRARISAVRGVNVDGVVRTLLNRGLLAENPPTEGGGAITFTTTEYFLERMGLAGLGELPPLAPHLPDASALEAELSQLAQTAEQEGPGQDAQGSTGGPQQRGEPVAEPTMDEESHDPERRP